jgi:hypothetical protein
MRRVLMGVLAIVVSLAALAAQEKEYKPTCNMCPGTTFRTPRSRLT